MSLASESACFSVRSEGAAFLAVCSAVLVSCYNAWTGVLRCFTRPLARRCESRVSRSFARSDSPTLLYIEKLAGTDRLVVVSVFDIQA